MPVPRWVVFVALLAAAEGCASPQPTPSSIPASSPPASAAMTPSADSTPTTAATAIDGLNTQVLDEALSSPSLELAIDHRLVRLTRDDFLSGLRRVRGREIVGGGPLSVVQFWFVVGARPDVADAAWVEITRHQDPAPYAYPTEPMADLIQIVDPSLPHGEATDLFERLRIGPERILHPAESDITAESRGVQYHLIGDAHRIYLFATKTN